jgi:hypothetical protein
MTFVQRQFSGVGESGGIMARTPLVVVPYGVIVTLNAAAGNIFLVVVTDAVAFTLANFLNSPTTGESQHITLIIARIAGGGVGANPITYGAAIKSTLADLSAVANATIITTHEFVWTGAVWQDVKNGAAYP